MTEKLLQYASRYVKSMKDEVPGLISLSVIEITSGRTILSTSDIKAVEEFNQLQTSTVKYALRGLEYISNLEVKKFEDIIITLEEQTHIIITSDHQAFMAYIILDANTGNIALTQTLHKKHYAKSVGEAMNDLGAENVRNHPFFQPKDLIALTTPVVEKKEEQKKSSFLHDLFFSN